ncbi:MAG: SDR family oxidoreductase [Gammaproteobacteria bacterium]|nr:SDR family oxidoreductase [Gammaproteobacteria bacterium]
MNQIDLKERTAVITGGAQGIGYAIAERFLASGARVVLWDRDSELLAEATNTLGGDSSAVTVDVAVPDSIANAVQSSTGPTGNIDILVNSAGIAGPNQPTWDYPHDAWRDVIDINLNGTFYCCHAVMPLMRKNGYGRILNIASIAGKEGNPTASAYSASKAGVIALTKSLGKETAKEDIAVNCITPAAAQTRILEQVSEQHIQYMLSKIPRERFVTVEEIASMVAWVVSAENSYTTGAVFDLSGGRATY